MYRTAPGYKNEHKIENGNGECAKETTTRPEIFVFQFLFFTQNLSLLISFELFYICNLGSFYSLVCVIGFAHC